MIRAVLSVAKKLAREFPTLIIPTSTTIHESEAHYAHGPEIWKTAKAKSPFRCGMVPAEHQRSGNSEGENPSVKSSVSTVRSLYYDFVSAAKQ